MADYYRTRAEYIAREVFDNPGLESFFANSSYNTLSQEWCEEHGATLDEDDEVNVRTKNYEKLASSCGDGKLRIEIILHENLGQQALIVEQAIEIAQLKGCLKSRSGCVAAPDDTNV